MITNVFSKFAFSKSVLGIVLFPSANLGIENYLFYIFNWLSNTLEILRIKLQENKNQNWSNINNNDVINRCNIGSQVKKNIIITLVQQRTHSTIS